jgi:hypothetical protein
VLQPVLTHAKPRDSARSELSETPLQQGVATAAMHRDRRVAWCARVPHVTMWTARCAARAADTGTAPTVSGHRHCGTTTTSLLEALPRMGKTPPLA